MLHNWQQQLQNINQLTTNNYKMLWNVKQNVRGPNIENINVENS